MLAEYKNGDFLIQLYEDGTLVRTGEGRADWPTSIDIKLTDYCDAGCHYCHESSTKRGAHGDINALLNVLDELPRGIELAIGGGNPLDHPQLIEFLRQVSIKGWVANLTVNQVHLRSHGDILHQLMDEDLVKGIGISMRSCMPSINTPIETLLIARWPHIVWHLIAGVNYIGAIDYLISLGDYCKVLVLGYKTYGRGINKGPYVDSLLKEWEQQVHRYVRRNGLILAFDNLALEQLRMHRFLSESEWSERYMGDDFTHSMYIDAVEGMYGPTSRSNERTSIKNMTLKSFFGSR